MPNTLGINSCPSSGSPPASRGVRAVAAGGFAAFKAVGDGWPWAAASPFLAVGAFLFAFVYGPTLPASFSCTAGISFWFLWKARPLFA